MANCLSCSRVVSQTFASLILIAGLVVTIWAIVTPAWQTVFIREFNAQHNHGLWMDCVEKRDSQTYSCSYKFDDTDSHSHGGHTHNAGAETQHEYHSWHKIVLGLLSASAFVSLIALVVSFCSICLKAPAVIWSICCAIATCLSAAGILIFFVNSHSKDNRFVHAATTTNEQSKGYSFWLAMAGLLCYLLATMMSSFTTVLICMQHKSSSLPAGSHKTWPKHQTQV